MSCKRAERNIKKGIALLDIGILQVKKQATIGEHAKIVQWLRNDKLAQRVAWELGRIMKYVKEKANHEVF